MQRTRYYGRRRVSPFRGVIQVIEQGEARAISINGRHWQLQLLSQKPSPEKVWGNIGPRALRRRWFVYGNCSETSAIHRVPVNPLVGDPARHPALPDLLVAIDARPSLPFTLQDRFEAWLCEAGGVPVVLLDTATEDEPRKTPGTNKWHSLPATDLAFQPASDYAAGCGMSPARALERLISTTCRAGSVSWFERGDGQSEAGLPELPWQLEWPSAGEQALVDDYTAHLAPFLLTLQTLDVALRDSLEAQAVGQFELLENIFPLIPVITDPERMEVARVKARLARDS